MILTFSRVHLRPIYGHYPWKGFLLTLTLSLSNYAKVIYCHFGSRDQCTGPPEFALRAQRRPVCPSVYLFVCLYVFLSFCFYYVYLTFCLSVFISFGLFDLLTFCLLPLSLSVRLFVCSYTFLVAFLVHATKHISA